MPRSTDLGDDNAFVNDAAAAPKQEKKMPEKKAVPPEKKAAPEQKSAPVAAAGAAGERRRSGVKPSEVESKKQTAADSKPGSLAPAAGKTGSIPPGKTGSIPPAAGSKPGSKAGSAAVSRASSMKSLMICPASLGAGHNFENGVCLDCGRTDEQGMDSSRGVPQVTMKVTDVAPDNNAMEATYSEEAADAEAEEPADEEAV